MERKYNANVIEKKWQKIWEERDSFHVTEDPDKKKYYTALGLRDGASQIEIKNAYKNLVSIYHPDVNKTSGAHKKMLEINEAYGELFNQILYNKEMNDLKKDPEAYHRARATYPIVFEDDEKGRNTSKNNYATNHNLPLIRIPYTHYKDLCLQDLLPETSKYLITTDSGYAAERIENV